MPYTLPSGHWGCRWARGNRRGAHGKVVPIAQDPEAQPDSFGWRRATGPFLYSWLPSRLTRVPIEEGSSACRIEDARSPELSTRPTARKRPGRLASGELGGRHAPKARPAQHRETPFSIIRVCLAATGLQEGSRWKPWSCWPQQSKLHLIYTRTRKLDAMAKDRAKDGQHLEAWASTETIDGMIFRVARRLRAKSAAGARPRSSSPRTDRQRHPRGEGTKGP